MVIIADYYNAQHSVTRQPGFVVKVFNALPCNTSSLPGWTYRHVINSAWGQTHV